MGVWYTEAEKKYKNSEEDLCVCHLYVMNMNMQTFFIVQGWKWNT